MPRRREMKGIAAGAAQTFISRYNDIRGYWALGILYKTAVDAGRDNLVLNLLSGVSQPPFPESNALANYYFKYILEQARARGFSESQVTDAYIELKFDVAPTPRQRVQWTWGEPYLCRVCIVDDIGRTRSFVVRGWCGVHDPKREHRSTRADTGWLRRFINRL